MQFEIIDAPALAQRLNLPESWVRDQTRRRATSGIPFLKFGKYVRFAWDSPELLKWIEDQKTGKRR